MKRVYEFVHCSPPQTIVWQYIHMTKLLIALLLFTSTTFAADRSCADILKDILNTKDEISKVTQVETTAYENIQEDVFNSSMMERITNNLFKEMEPMKGDQFKDEYGVGIEKLKEILETAEIPNGLKVKYNFATSSTDPGNTFVLMNIYNPEGHMSGYIITRFINNDDAFEIYQEFIKFDSSVAEVKGVAEPLKNITLDIGRKLGHTKETLDADWIGRYVWARRDFDFSKKSYFMLNGERLTPLELVRGNLERFIKYHKLEDVALGLKTKDGVKPITISELNKPVDFTNVVALDGTKLEIKPLVDDHKLGDLTEMEVGKAFVLSPHYEEADQVNEVISRRGVNMSDRAMPYWDGEKPLE